MAEKKSDLGPRLVTAIVAIPILLYIIFIAPAWGFALLVLFAAGVSVWEYCSITYGEAVPLGKWAFGFLGASLFAILYWTPAYFLVACAGAVLFAFLFFLFAYEEMTEVSHQIGSSITGVFYGSILLGCAALLMRDAGAAGPLWILILLIIVWFSDTGAYFTGRAFGKTKLAPRVSPNKSVEGAAGGFVISVGSAVGLNYLFGATIGAEGIQGQVFGVEALSYALAWKPVSLGTMLLIAIPANLLGQAGDLAESLIKRAHKVKDSGSIIYGHGGMLDRIDALIFASPWVYYCFIEFVR